MTAKSKSGAAAGSFLEGENDGKTNPAPGNKDPDPNLVRTKYDGKIRYYG